MKAQVSHPSSPNTKTCASEGQPWKTEEDSLLLKAFNEGKKITELTRLHARSYGAIKARLIKLRMLEK